MNISIGTRLSRYEIHSKIGEGGMGKVYLAEDTSLHRKVALKVLPEELASNKDRMRRFVQEAQAAENREYMPRFLKVDPSFDAIRDDPRFKELLAELREVDRGHVRCQAFRASRGHFPQVALPTSGGKTRERERCGLRPVIKLLKFGERFHAVGVIILTAAPGDETRQ